MTSLEAELRAELEGDGAAGTLKPIPVLSSPQGPVVEVEGRGEVLCLCSNDYLGLANHPAVVEAGGRGAGALRRRDRLGALHLRQVRAPGRARARPRRVPATPSAALTFVSCWTANAALLDALCDERTAVFSDRLNHASIIDGMRLARPAHKAVYEHADADDLRRALAAAPRLGAPADRHRRRLQHGGRPGAARRPGSRSPREHDATLIVDDSHGIGVVGETGRGVLEHFGAPRRTRS